MHAPAHHTVTLDSGTRLAADRTRLAHERTLMAWVRTAASLISFGFSVYKFFDLSAGARPDLARHLFGPREFALTMITIGLVSLLLSTFQHRQSMRRLRAEYGDMFPTSTATIVAALFSFLGLATLIVVLLHQ